MTATRFPRNMLTMERPRPNQLKRSSRDTPCTSQGTITGTSMSVGKVLFHFWESRRSARDAVIPSMAETVLTAKLNQKEKIVEAMSSDPEKSFSYHCRVNSKGKVP